jgi:hypothetical protein
MEFFYFKKTFYVMLNSRSHFDTLFVCQHRFQESKMCNYFRLHR